MRGKNARETVRGVVESLNKKKKIKIRIINEDMLRDYYVLAYSQSIMSYEEELEPYFKDEKAKNV